MVISVCLMVKPAPHEGVEEGESSHNCSSVGHHLVMLMLMLLLVMMMIVMVKAVMRTTHSTVTKI